MGSSRIFPQANDSVGLWTLLTLNDVEFDVIALFQGFVPIQLNRRVVDEYVGPVFTSDESVAFGVIEPLDFSFVLSHRPPLSLHREKYATGEGWYEDGEFAASLPSMTGKQGQRFFAGVELLPYCGTRVGE